jgi:hypothetical protein
MPNLSRSVVIAAPVGEVFAYVMTSSTGLGT